MSSFLSYLRERQLKNDLLSGKIDSLELLFNTYAEKLFLYALSLLNSPLDAEEVVQNMFLKLARNPEVLKKVDNLKAYLYSALRNTALDYRQKQKKEISLEDYQACGIFAIEAANSEEQIFLAGQVEKLPPEQKEVLVLKIYQELSFKEIAKLLTISPDTAASRYRYALKNLKKQLGDKI